MKRFVLRRLATILYTTGLVGMSSQVMASAFQLWEQDGASIGNYHAGYAALAEDASTAFYNPAGIIRIQNKQVVAGADAIMSSFKYRGTIAVNGLGGLPMPVTAQGGTFSVVPFLHYVAPITEKIGFGFSVDAPFGLKTNYGSSTTLRYAATLSSLTVIDISPSLGFLVSEKGSLGIGLDLQRVIAEFDDVATLLTPANNTTSQTKATGTAFGYHFGGLYQFSENTRLGLSYHSQMVHHLTGSSKFIGPLNALTGGPLETSRAKANVTLPPYTALSAFHQINSQFAIMGSVIYTQWNTFKNLIINNVAGLVPGGPPPFGLAPSGNIQVTIPAHYRNTWNLSLGGNYYPTDKVIIRAGIGFDETPVLTGTRNVQIPDNNRYVIALGGHYQATKIVGVDLGWTHFFIGQSRINPPPQVTGAQVVVTNGHVTGGADVFGGQIVLDVA